MEHLAHDPRSKQLIKDGLYAFLYAPIENQFKNRIDVLCTRNSILGGFSHKSFFYKGTVYNSEITQPPTSRNKLIPQLRAEMEAYLQDLQDLNQHEVPFVLGYINQVLNSSNDFKDYLRLFPESIHYPLERLMATCPCQNKHLTDEKVLQIKERNQQPISLMKQRLVNNLLI